MRYAKQELAKDLGWNQKKLQDANIAVIGSSNLASLVLADLIAMGYGKITKIGETTLPFLKFDELNPEISLTQIPTSVLNKEMAEEYIEKPDFIIDLSNKKQKKIILDYAIQKQIPGISGYCDNQSYSIRLLNNKEDILNYHEYREKDGTVNAVIASGIIAEETRKHINPLKNDKKLQKFSVRNLEEKVNKKILMVGAGAIGTFTGISLALQNIDFDVLDFDEVEESNLNRQILFYDSIVNGIIDKVDENYKLNNHYDIILSCVDNAKARYFLDWLCFKNKIPFINSGTSFSQGNVMPYVPGKTACIDCQSFFRISEKKDAKDNSCYEPTVITSNQIIGGLLANKISHIPENTETIKYNSNLGIKKVKTIQQCLKGCKKNGK